MGRRLREQPRVVAASALGLVALALAVALVTAALSDDGDEKAALTEAAASAERRESALRTQLRDAERSLAAAERELDRGADRERELRRARLRLERENRRLVRQARRLRRQLAQAGEP